MRVSFASVRVAVLLTALFWMAALLRLHKKVIKEHRQTDAVAVERITQRGRLLFCGKQRLRIDGDRRCVKRYDWLLENWKLDPCLSQLKSAHNDSTTLDIDCYIYRHLVYVERSCPEPRDAAFVFAGTLLPKSRALDIIPRAGSGRDFKDLLNRLDECGEVCEWISKRVKRMEEKWTSSALQLAKIKRHEPSDKRQGVSRDNDSSTATRRVKLSVLLHMGLLTKEIGLNFGLAAFHGGPLGELVQWADLASSLHALGHDVTLSWSPERLEQVLKHKTSVCQSARRYDFVFTDIIGLQQIQDQLGSLYLYRCVIRILDVYGTEPEFNHPLFSPQISNNRRWGGRGLDPGQFLTHFPHSPDNSFLGFVVEKAMASDIPNSAKKIALIYGKRKRIFKGRNKLRFLQTLSENFDEVHATVREDDKDGDNSDMPDFVINHSRLHQTEFLDLLRRSAVYVGLGLPVEGPAALEALAQGAVFLNPRFNPPRFVGKDKPTNRRLTSQNPYAENSIGPPFVFTVNIGNLTQVNETLKQIRNSKRPRPYVTYEFTHEGFLERLNSYLENQDFCTESLRSVSLASQVFWKRKKRKWPPVSALKVQLSHLGESCSAGCARRKMVCERTFFALINSTKVLRANGVDCATTTVIFPKQQLIEARQSGKRDVSVTCHAPSYVINRGECIFQSDELLYSCACVPSNGAKRVCPCREFKHEQSALCLECE